MTTTALGDVRLHFMEATNDAGNLLSRRNSDWLEQVLGIAAALLLLKHEFFVTSEIQGHCRLVALSYPFLISHRIQNKKLTSVGVLYDEEDRVDLCHVLCYECGNYYS